MTLAHYSLCLFLLASASARAKDAATDRTEGFIAQLMKVKEDNGKLTAAQKEANQKVFGQIDGFFDFDKLTSDAIEPLKDKFTPQERADYQKKLRELIRLVAYPDSGAWFREAQYKILPSAEKGDLLTVTVDAKLPKRDLETKVALVWKKSKDGLKIIDVNFDGDSVVKDYQNQFAKIVEKEGAKGLIARLDKKRAEFDAPPKAK